MTLARAQIALLNRAVKEWVPTVYGAYHFASRVLPLADGGKSPFTHDRGARSATGRERSLLPVLNKDEGEDHVGQKRTRRASEAFGVERLGDSLQLVVWRSREWPDGGVVQRPGYLRSECRRDLISPIG